MRARATLCVLATALLIVGGLAAQECDATDTLCHRAKAAAASAPPKMIPDDAPDLSSPPRPTKTAEDDPSPPEPSSTRVASCAVCEAALTEHAAAVDDLSAELTSMKASVADAEARVLAATKRAEEVRLLPIRPRSRGARRSLRTFPVVTLHPRFPFNV